MLKYFRDDRSKVAKRGFNLIELGIAMAMSTLIGWGVYDLTLKSKSAMTVTDLNSDVTYTITSIRSALRTPIACDNTFKDRDTQTEAQRTLTAIYNSDNEPIAIVGQPFPLTRSQTSQVKVDAMKFDAPTKYNEAQLYRSNLRVTFSKRLTNTQTIKAERIFPVNFSIDDTLAPPDNTIITGCSIKTKNWLDEFCLALGAATVENSQHIDPGTGALVYDIGTYGAMVGRCLNLNVAPGLLSGDAIEFRTIAHAQESLMVGVTDLAADIVDASLIPGGFDIAGDLFMRGDLIVSDRTTGTSENRLLIDSDQALPSPLPIGSNGGLVQVGNNGNIAATGVKQNMVGVGINNFGNGLIKDAYTLVAGNDLYANNNLVAPDMVNIEEGFRVGTTVSGTIYSYTDEIIIRSPGFNLIDQKGIRLNDVVLIPPVDHTITVDKTWKVDPRQEVPGTLQSTGQGTTGVTVEYVQSIFNRGFRGVNISGTGTYGANRLLDAQSRTNIFDAFLLYVTAQTDATAREGMRDFLAGEFVGATQIAGGLSDQLNRCAGQTLAALKEISYDDAQNIWNVQCSYPVPDCSQTGKCSQVCISPTQPGSASNSYCFTGNRFGYRACAPSTATCGSANELCCPPNRFAVGYTWFKSIHADFDPAAIAATSACNVTKTNLTTPMGTPPDYCMTLSGPPAIKPAVTDYSMSLMCCDMALQGYRNNIVIASATNAPTATPTPPAPPAPTAVNYANATTTATVPPQCAGGIVIHGLCAGNVGTFDYDQSVDVTNDLRGPAPINEHGWRVTCPTTGGSWQTETNFTHTFIYDSVPVANWSSGIGAANDDPCEASCKITGGPAGVNLPLVTTTHIGAPTTAEITVEVKNMRKGSTVQFNCSSFTTAGIIDAQPPTELVNPFGYPGQTSSNGSMSLRFVRPSNPGTYTCKISITDIASGLHTCQNAAQTGDGTISFTLDAPTCAAQTISVGDPPGYTRSCDYPLPAAADGTVLQACCRQNSWNNSNNNFIATCSMSIWTFEELGRNESPYCILGDAYYY